MTLSSRALGTDPFTGLSREGLFLVGRPKAGSISVEPVSPFLIGCWGIRRAGRLCGQGGPVPGSRPASDAGDYFCARTVVACDQ